MEIVSKLNLFKWEKKKENLHHLHGDGKGKGNRGKAESP